MTGEELAAGVCVCGRDIPKHSPSDWACSEPCQTAWLHHHANPEYPHPREIREAAEQRLAEQRRNPPPFPGRPAGGGGVLPPIAEGTEVNTDHGLFVRVGHAWRPAGMWTPATGHRELTEEVAYQRWCPRCRGRRPSRIEASADVDLVSDFAESSRWEHQQQECVSCGHVWQGRPLIGVIESRGEPWPALRLRLTDGHRSATTTFAEREITAAVAGRLAERLRRTWPRLERQLGGGYCDADEPTSAQQARAQRARRRQWDVTDDHVHVQVRR